MSCGVLEADEQIDTGIARALRVTRLARGGADGQEAPVPAADIPDLLQRECRPWDYQRYPVDRRDCVTGSTGANGSRNGCLGLDLDDPRLILTDSAEKIEARQVLPRHALSDHWAELARRFDDAGRRGRQVPALPVDYPVYDLTSSGSDCN